MLKGNITIPLEEAKEWYNSDNAILKDIALRAYSKQDLEMFDFTKIKTFADALEALGYSVTEQITLNNIAFDIRCKSKASAAMFKLNIIRRALNKGYNLHLTKNADGQNCTWYPYFRFVTKSSTYYDDELKSGEYKKLGKITNEGITYDVLGGRISNNGDNGLGDFDSIISVGYVSANLGFLGCATKEITEHFGEYFGMLIMEAMYGDMVDFKVVEE